VNAKQIDAVIRRIASNCVAAKCHLLTAKCNKNARAPQWLLGGTGFLCCVRRCPTFPPGLGSIIGAGRLSFRVRDGSGRFPVAVTAVTLFMCYWWWGVGCGLVCGCVCVSFRPVSASSLSALLRV
jgi:hypothetical protein